MSVSVANRITTAGQILVKKFLKILVSKNKKISVGLNLNTLKASLWNYCDFTKNLHNCSNNFETKISLHFKAHSYLSVALCIKASFLVCFTVCSVKFTGALCRVAMLQLDVTVIASFWSLQCSSLLCLSVNELATTPLQ